ncbi:DUF2290 domain-containing protein [Roseivirga thermotolerans]|nr:DUF2290 domain-containing protein [Roseivirga thermotolerans]
MAKFLKSMDLLEEFNPNPEKLGLNLAEIRKLSFEKLWKTHFAGNCYHFHLLDGALINFNVESQSFSYFGNPFDCMTFTDFLHEHGYMDDSDKYVLGPDYEQYVSECAIKEFPFAIRYDYDETSYNEGLHPVSHLHLGINNSTRIGIKKLIDPEAFIYFIVRQLYPEYWQKVLQDSKQISRIEKAKSAMPAIENKYYNKKDQIELYLE